MKHRNKKEAKNVLFKKKGIWKEKKALLQWRAARVVEMKGIVILVKVDEMYYIMESLLTTV